MCACACVCDCVCTKFLNNSISTISLWVSNLETENQMNYFGSIQLLIWIDFDRVIIVLTELCLPLARSVLHIIDYDLRITNQEM